MKNIRLGIKILKTLTKDRIQYPGRLVVDTVGMFARCGILLLLYHYVFALNNNNIHGINFLQAAWSIFFYFSFSSLRLRDLSRLIMQDIQRGDVEVLFSKPISYVLYRFWWQLGLGLYSFIVLAISFTILLYGIIGVPETMKMNIFFPTLMMTLVFSTILSLLVYAFIGLFAFWIEDIMPIFWVIDKSIMMLGGSYLPVALFPDTLYWFAKYSPFGATNFVTHTTSKLWESQWVTFALLQVGWILAFSGIVFIQFSQARKKVSVNGG